MARINVRQWFARLVSFLQRSRGPVLAVSIAILLADILFVPQTIDVIIWMLLLLTAFLSWVYALTSRMIFALSFFLFLIMTVSYVFSGPSIITEKAAVWVVLFVFCGVVKQWRELA